MKVMNFRMIQAVIKSVNYHDEQINKRIEENSNDAFRNSFECRW